MNATDKAVKLNRIEEKLLSRWELLIQNVLEEAEIYSIWGEVVLFMDALLPREPSEDWAFWTDGSMFLTKSEELANRLADIVDKLALCHTGFYDPKEDEESGTENDHTGYWYVDFD